MLYWFDLGVIRNFVEVKRSGISFVASLATDSSRLRNAKILEVSEDFSCECLGCTPEPFVFCVFKTKKPPVVWFVVDRFGRPNANIFSSASDAWSHVTVYRTDMIADVQARIEASNRDDGLNNAFSPKGR